MNKCPKCGQEFEGKFCPECGTVWQDEKSCPNCGIRLIGSVKFCPECGYSFYSGGQPQPQQKQPSKLKQKLSAVGKWIKAHLKVVIPVSIALVALIVILSLIPTFVAMQTNGTYYACENGEIDVESYITLKNGKWSDEDGESGKYKVKGNDITIYVEFFGETEEFASGTVKNGVLTLDMGGDDCIYVSKKHKHKFDEWTVVTEATCTNEGLQTRVCACGYKEKEVIPQLPHAFDGDWHFDAINHWHYCTTCESEIDFGEHDDEDNCTICGYHLLTYNLNNDNTAYIVTGNNLDDENYKTDISIPSTYNGLPVTSIGIEAFSGCSSLTSVTIPDSVTFIGIEAFSGCNSLTSINIPDSVTAIGSKAFSGCSSLMYNEYDNAYYLGNGNNSFVLLVQAKNKNISSCVINNFTKFIDAYAFFVCSSLTSISIPDSVNSISEYAFYNCSALTSVTIPDSVTTIGNSAFSGCTSLESIAIPDSVASIDRSAFAHCYSLTSINIPDSVISIGSEAFSSCRSLTSVTIPDRVTSIGERAFYKCRSLTSITIPDSVTRIGREVFSGCNSLTSITVASGNTKYHSAGNCIIETESKTLIAGCKNSVIPTDGSVTRIGSGAFYNCSSLTSIMIPDTVTYIGSYAFSECSSLTSVTIPDSVNSISEYAFYNCSALTSITIGDGVTEIGRQAFNGCRALTDINYNGTKEQWNAISKGSNWNYNTGNYTVHCTDGDIAKQ